jgi:hypothetical protein
MTALRRVPISLSADTLERVKQALGAALPHWGGRVNTVSIEEIEQPFFKSWKILEVISPSPLPDLRSHLAWQPGGGALLVLTGELAHLYEVATADPPRGLLDDTAAETYAWNASGWTTESHLRDFRVNAASEIPWLPQLKPEDKQLIEEITREGRIAPLKVQRTAAGLVLHYFLLNNKRLIERRLLVPPSGLLQRKDAVLRENLPVPPGRIWKMINGRPTPAG